jgi:hypothetical protein
LALRLSEGLGISAQPINLNPGVQPGLANAIGAPLLGEIRHMPEQSTNITNPNPNPISEFSDPKI